MLKTAKQPLKLGIGPFVLYLIFKVVKVLENYYTIAISSQLVLEWIQLNLLHSLKTCSCSNLLKVSSSGAKYDITCNNLFKNCDVPSYVNSYSIKQAIRL